MSTNGYPVADDGHVDDEWLESTFDNDPDVAYEWHLENRGYDEARAQEAFDAQWNPIEQGMYDDDPSPYAGTYSEE